MLIVINKGEVMKSRNSLTAQQVRDEFRRKGITAASWADANGFSRASVSHVLTGRNSASTGVGHKIAVLLGLKDGEILDCGSHD